MIAAEFRRLTASRMAVIALVALTAVPILYGGLYLWANQDPYDSLDQVPVALVVEDEGALLNGEPVTYGDDIAEQLLDDGAFDWHLVSAADATAGVNNSTYDFSVTLPADFSEALVSASGDNPRQADVVLTTNDANSYLATTIGEQATKAIRVSITQTVNEKAALQFLVGLSTIRDNLVTAVDGASQLVSGASSATDGAGQLAEGVAQLASGAAQVSDGNAALATKADELGAVSADAAARLPEARAQIQQLLVDQGLTQDEIDKVLARLDPVATTLADANTQVQTTVGQIDQLAAGSAQLASGVQSAASGAASLTEGLGTLTDGIGTLKQGLEDGVGRIPSTDETSRQRQASAIADPVSLETSAVTAAGTYGAGLAPFFSSLAAWIGIYALFLIVKPVSRRAVTALHSPVKVTLAGWLTPGILGMVQMAGLFFVLSVVLGFSMSSPLGVYAILALSSLTFAAMILALNVWLGSVGQFVGLVLMVVQLVTAGGTFPWQTLPAPLAALHHVLPMSYTVDGMRQLMYGGNAASAATDALVLGAWMLGALVIAGIGVTRMTHFRTLRDLQPSLIG